MPLPLLPFDSAAPAPIVLTKFCTMLVSSIGRMNLVEGLLPTFSSISMYCKAIVLLSISAGLLIDRFQRHRITFRPQHLCLAFAFGLARLGIVSALRLRGWLIACCLRRV